MDVDESFSNSKCEGEDNSSFQDGDGFISDTHHDENGAVKPGTRNDISTKESQEVRRFKNIVLAFLFVAAISFAIFISLFIRNNETQEFEDTFYKSAYKVFEGMAYSIDRTLVPVDTLAMTLVSYAKSVNDTWPFVTYPNFGLHLAKMLPDTDGCVIQYMPLVQPNQREEWEIYSSKHNQWVDENLEIQKKWDNYQGYWSSEWEVYRMYSDHGDIPDNITRTMAPQWQTFPSSMQYYYAYNWDWLSQVHTDAILAAIDNKRAVIQSPYLIPRPDDPARQAESEGWVAYFKDFIEADEDAFEPAFDVTYPIVNDVTQVDLLESAQYSNQTVVGFITLTVYFREMIRNILPPGSDGMIIVFNNTCAIPFAYQINGPNVTYLGISFEPDGKYDHLVVTSSMTELGEFLLQTSHYSGLPIDTEYCPYTISLHPSSTMEEEHRTNNAVIFMFVSILSFGALAVLFLLYDLKVERRQTKVLSSAVRSSEIVSSLFPSSVHDQLYQSNSHVDPSTNTASVDGQISKENSSSYVVGNPIAKLYPETTIMFADIKGFTHWSDNREPTQVFKLLESIYGRFDSIARLYGVFKVETIGDTYVAVMGLPNPRKRHAVIMAKFAMSCIDAMKTITVELAETLGKETMELSIRVGLNSGPTTAGVLRGEKARFQLFGDTVNTASRMESNGDSDKIHVSEATAKLIEQYGKGHWLSIREDQVMVKGKGMMQTYWCNPRVDVPSDNRAASSCASSDDVSCE